MVQCKRGGLGSRELPGVRPVCRKNVQEAPLSNLKMCAGSCAMELH